MVAGDIKFLRQSTTKTIILKITATYASTDPPINSCCMKWFSSKRISKGLPIMWQKCSYIQYNIACHKLSNIQCTILLHQYLRIISLGLTQTRNNQKQEYHRNVDRFSLLPPWFKDICLYNVTNYITPLACYLKLFIQLFKYVILMTLETHFAL